MTITGKNIHGTEITFTFSPYMIDVVKLIVEKEVQLARESSRNKTRTGPHKGKYGKVWSVYILHNPMRLKQKDMDRMYSKGILKAISAMPRAIYSDRKELTWYHFPQWVLDQLELQGIGKRSKHDLQTI